jgi:3-oxoacyl-(acyl-carrier-protein) synthase
MTGAVTGAATLAAAELEQPAVAELLHGERLRSVSLESRLLLAAARLALRDARERTGGPDGDADALGIVVATRHAGLQDYVELFREGTAAERPRVRPAKGPQTGLTAPATEASIRLPAAGPNATVSNGSVGGLDALRYALDRLAAGDADAMLVCEVDVTPALVRGSAVGGEDTPAQRVAAVVLEREATVRARGATPYALLLAVATAFSPTGDAAEAQARVLDAVLDAGGVAAPPVAAPPDAPGAVVQLADAAARLAREAARGPRTLRASDGWSAGAAVLQPQPAGGR